MTKAIFIDWCPKDALDGMVQLDVWEELAYRRVLDFIYVTGNNLKDDDRKLGWMTKTGKRWPRIKQALLADDKIYIQGGLVRNKKCDVKLDQLDQKIAQKRKAGKSSAAQRKSLGNNAQGPTAVATDALTDVPTDVPTAGPTEGATEGQRTQEPKNPSKEKTPSGAKKKPGITDLTVRMFEAFAKEHAADVNVLLELERFRDWCRAKGKRFKDNPAAFRNWLRKAQEFHNERQGNSVADPSGEYTDDQGVRRSSFTNSPMPEGAA